MVNEASDELEAIGWDDRLKPEVLAVRCELYLTAQKWDMAADIACSLAGSHPEEAEWWVHWAYALREDGKVAEAKAVALRGLERHPDEAILHFNLACYLSLLGELDEAKVELRRSIELDRSFQKVAADDPDLEAVWESFGE